MPTCTPYRIFEVKKIEESLKYESNKREKAL